MIAISRSDNCLNIILICFSLFNNEQPSSIKQSDAYIHHKDNIPANESRFFRRPNERCTAFVFPLIPECLTFEDVVDNVKEG